MKNEAKLRRTIAIEMVKIMGYKGYKEYLLVGIENAKGFQKEAKIKGLKALEFVVAHKLVQI